MPYRTGAIVLLVRHALRVRHSVGGACIKLGPSCMPHEGDALRHVYLLPSLIVQRGQTFRKRTNRSVWGPRETKDNVSHVVVNLGPLRRLVPWSFGDAALEGLAVQCRPGPVGLGSSLVSNRTHTQTCARAHTHGPFDRGHPELAQLLMFLSQQPHERHADVLQLVVAVLLVPVRIAGHVTGRQERLREAPDVLSNLVELLRRVHALPQLAGGLRVLHRGRGGLRDEAADGVQRLRENFPRPPERLPRGSEEAVRVVVVVREGRQSTGALDQLLGSRYDEPEAQTEVPGGVMHGPDQT